MLKNELKRAFTNSGMILSLIVGHTISILYIISIYQKKFKAAEIIKTYGIVQTYTGMSQNSPFDVWFMGAPGQYFVSFIYLMPVIVALPYAASYGKERKSGYDKNIVTRITRRKYRAAKYAAVFISGGVATASVSFCNLMWTFSYMKYRAPISCSLAPLARGRTMLGVFYYSHPFLYCMVYVLALFIFSGAVATVSLMISDFTTNFFTVTLTPFLIIMIFNSILTEEAGFYLPSYFLSPLNSGDKLYLVPLYCAVVMTITFLEFVVTKRNKENL